MLNSHCLLQIKRTSSSITLRLENPQKSNRFLPEYSALIISEQVDLKHQNYLGICLVSRCKLLNKINNKWVYSLQRNLQDS